MVQKNSLQNNFESELDISRSIMSSGNSSPFPYARAKESVVAGRDSMNFKTHSETVLKPKVWLQQDSSKFDPTSFGTAKPKPVAQQRYCDEETDCDEGRSSGARRSSWLSRLFSKITPKGKDTSESVESESGEKQAKGRESQSQESDEPKLLPGVPKPWHGVRLTPEEKAARLEKLREDIWMLVSEGQRLGHIKVMRRPSTEASFFLDH